MHLPAQCLQHAGQRPASTRVVVCQQSTHFGRPSDSCMGDIMHRQWQLKAEGAALARAAVHAQLAPHESHDPLADDQPQSCATVKSGSGRFCLGKTREDTLALLCGDADTRVPNFKACAGNAVVKSIQVQPQGHRA